MENLNSFGLVELSREEMQEVNGGWWLAALSAAVFLLVYLFGGDQGS